MGYAKAFILIFFSISSSKVSDSLEQRSEKIAEDIAEYAFREFELAKTVNDGYTRVFSMPPNIDGIDYDIKIIQNVILITYPKWTYLSSEFRADNSKFLTLLEIPIMIGNVNKRFVGSLSTKKYIHCT